MQRGDESEHDGFDERERDADLLLRGGWHPAHERRCCIGRASRLAPRLQVRLVGGCMAERRDPKRYWSRAVTEQSNALDLEPGVFKGTPAEIARSLKRSAERSTRRKAPPFRSAMSMIVFYENRAGANLSASRKRDLDRAKDELRKLYGRPTKRSR